MKPTILVILIEIMAGIAAHAQKSPENVSGELYIQTGSGDQGYPVSASVALVGMGFIGLRGNPKIYSNLDTNSSGVVQSITGPYSHTFQSTDHGEWILQHIEKSNPIPDSPWIGFGLYEICLVSEPLGQFGLENEWMV